MKLNNKMWGEAPNNLLLLQKNKKSWYSSSYIEEDILYKSIFVKKNIYPWEFYNYRFCLQIFSVREGVTQDGDELVVLLLVPQCQVFVWHCHSNTPAAFDTHVTSSIFLISLHLLNAPPPPSSPPPPSPPLYAGGEAFCLCLPCLTPFKLLLMF